MDISGWIPSEFNTLRILVVGKPPNSGAQNRLVPSGSDLAPKGAHRSVGVQAYYKEMERATKKSSRRPSLSPAIRNPVR